jgi:hypothetical protein
MIKLYYTVWCHIPVDSNMQRGHTVWQYLTALADSDMYCLLSSAVDTVSEAWLLYQCVTVFIFINKFY